MRIDSKSNGDAGRGRPLQFREFLPWPDEIEGDRVATALAATIKRFVRMTDAQADVCALWVLLSWTIDKFSIAPRLCITSPTKGCGKSTLLHLLGQVSYRPLSSGSVTPAALFRAIEKFHPTLFLDENEKYLEIGSDFHALLNQGHRRGQYVLRTQGDDHELVTFDTFCMVAFARNGRIPDDLEQRSIIVELQRQLRGETAEVLKDGEHLDNLARMCHRWADDYARDIAEVPKPDMGNLINRVADNWRPLFVIADVIGEDWPNRIRASCAELTKSEPDSNDTQLLGDIKVAFEETDRLFSETLCEALAAMEGRPWAEYGRSGKPITKNQLAARLRRFKADAECQLPIEPKTLWIGGESQRGYERHQFLEAWNRYLTESTPEHPPNRPSGCQTTDEMGTSATFQGVRQGVNRPSARASEASADTRLTPQLTPQKCEKSAPNGHSDALTPCTGGVPRVCGFCGQPGELLPTAYGDAEAEVHAECQKPWVASL
jgi:putative DNA primase/helicase